MAHWDALIDNLTAADLPVRLDWDEFASLGGDLPASAPKLRTWWSGDRPHVNVWKAAGFTLTDLRLGDTVTFARAEAWTAPSTHLGRRRHHGLQQPRRPLDVRCRHQSAFVAEGGDGVGRGFRSW